MCSTIASSGDMLTDQDGIPPSTVARIDGKPLAPYDKSDNSLRPHSISGRLRTLRCGGHPITVTGTVIGVVIGSGSGQAG
ncbi:hypothetical protein ACXRSW_08290 [Aeromonas dhakensis]|uniref:hypothetical protein n=1 Tax=Aeromonas TaxID=642 RepID=UPI001CEFCFE6|nr:MULTISPECIES: hypothetical protein [Aeromonas]MDD9306594.1 hypothetical protein [Aeromonas hydrophila]UCM46191.1 hypothetical protein LEO73_05340 [Aeromonas dhakensis]UCM54378.1 hypothetical protein LEO81_05335 [Aeromonas dhakensis]WPS58775.1 hypothetical protein RDV79_09130 [Aeromonas dhakensis]WRT72047.1 hypothetical protein VK677_17140 [Aeromonas dhakensis]